MKLLISAAREDPASAANTLCCSNGIDLTGFKQRRQLSCAAECGQIALPFSKYCLQHQCNDSGQLLYPMCCGVDSIKCKNTVLDIFSDSSLCTKHLSDSNSIKRKSALHVSTRTLHKKVKVGTSKVVRKGSGKLKLKADRKGPSPIASSEWSSNSDSSNLPLTEGTAKLPPSSKSLDDLLSLGSSLTASLPKLDLLPLKADIGEIMMAGEDSSGDDQPHE